MRTVTLGVVVFLIGLAGWLTVPGYVVSSLNVPMVEGQPSAGGLPAWLAPLAISFELLVAAGAAMVIVGLVKRSRRKRQ